ncbi:MAG: type III pantothenate kinase [Luminiphilus sp.]
MKDAPQWLLLDVGNSAIKWRLATPSGLMPEGGRAEDVSALASMLAGRTWEHVAIASVAGDAVDADLAAIVTAGHGDDVHFATSDAELQGLRNRYQAPETLGVDRWLAMLAAWHHHGGPLCVIDAGTALTLDLVSGEGEHEGGFILPGAELMHRSLGIGTGKIRVDGLAAPMVTPGGDTAACVNAGVWLATKGLLIASQAAYPNYRFLLTGGGAASLQVLMPEMEHQPDLVMEGLRLWLATQLDDRLP